ncbi:MAG: cell cycle transcriptional regulator TrcR [Rickettsiales bacterium]
MNQILMPVATAKWLIQNTSLTFEQIANFCNIHELEVQAIADDEAGQNIKPLSPIGSQLTQEEIDRCTKDSSLTLNKLSLYEGKSKKGKKYVSALVRKEKAEGICWILRNYPDASEKKIIELFKTTKTAIQTMKNKIAISPDETFRSPVILGLCTKDELDLLILT